MKEPLFIVVDLFCGFGGTTKGFVLAKLMQQNIAKVIACINHDPKAIKSHWLNNQDVKHFEEDIRTLDLTELNTLAKHYQTIFPDAKLILWASLECTNFSKAKGGQPRNADSRTLADHLERYITALDPDFIQIENVVEFMSWGPLDEKGKPISRKNGSDWMRWRKNICSLGYKDDWKELNSADFGAYTSRNRLFGIFAKEYLPITWPLPTHAKKPSKLSMYGDLKKWMPVKDVLNFSDEGESIFTRKKPLSDNTLERIYAGLLKYIANGDKAFISKYFSGTHANKTVVEPISMLKYNSTDKNGKHYPPSLEEPSPVVTTRDALGIIQGEFLVQRNSGKPESKLVDVNSPARTITATGGNQDLVQAKFLSAYHGNGANVSSVENPSPTIPTKDSIALVQPEYLINYNHSSETNDVNEPSPTLVTRDKLGLVQPEYFIDKQYGGYKNNQSIDQPAGSILSNDKHALVKAEAFIMPTNYDNSPKSIDEPAPTITASRKHHYLINPSWGGNPGDINEPCCVIVARQDKAPLYFVQVESGTVSIAVFDNDSEISIKIKQFMAAFGLVDIKMRMLKVPELLKIQGFPENYKMVGNQSDQKKFIGNSVVPLVVKAWTEALALKLIETKNYKVA